MSNISNTAPSLAAKKATVIPTTAQSQRGGAFSVNLVCANHNRKSLTLTKKLADALQLTAGVYITLYADDGSIALSPASIDENSVWCKFSNDKDRIVYNANLVRFIADTFALDYTVRTSMSFNRITFGSINGIKYAEVIMSDKPIVASSTAEIAEEVEADTVMEEFDDDSNI